MHALVLLLLATLACGVCGDIYVATYASTAFGGAPPTITTQPALLLASPALSSTRATGTVSVPTPQLILFSVRLSAPAAASVLLWVDDHLLLDTAARGATAYINHSFSSTAPLLLRLDWIHASPTAGTLELWWSGNSTPAAPVPASALGAAVAPSEQAREALRERMAAPPWQWGTYHNPSMSTHVLLPQALAVAATLGNRTSGEQLGKVFVFRGDNPAAVRVGGHGYDGSTFTEVQIDAWRGAPCSVVFATTVSAGGQLYFLATSNGTACSGLALLVTFDYLWGRVGAAVNGSSSLHVQASAPGFAPVDIYATQPSVFFPNASAHGSYFALALQDGGTVGYSTGSPVAPAAMAASIDAARAVHAQRRARFPGDLADAYDAQQSILAWNSMFTPYEGVVTPVSRGWDHGAGYVLFAWDNLFLAWQASLEEDSKDLAYSNLIQIVQSRTPPGFVPNYHSGTHDATDRSEPQIGALMTLQVYLRYKEAWVVEKLLDTLLGWAEWVWSQRTAATPSGGVLVVLGSDLNFPHDERNIGTLQAATLESGIDNGAAYEDLTAQDWDAAALRMRQFDVGASALFAAECEALIELAGVVGRSDVVPTLTARRAAIASAMEATMWNEAEGVYENTLANVSSCGAAAAASPLFLYPGSHAIRRLLFPPHPLPPPPPTHTHTPHTPGHLSQAPHAHGLLPHDWCPPLPCARHLHAAPAHLPQRILR